MSGRFDGKSVLITGEGTGIGAATARRIVSEGGKLVVTGRRPEPIRAIADELGGIAVAGDAVAPAHLSAAIDAAVTHFGGLDIVICNAANTMPGSVTDIAWEDWRKAYETNVDGAALLARLAVPEMKQRGGGALVIVASLAALSDAPNMASYLTTKAALLGLNRSIAYDYGIHKIRSNVVCPGWVRTEMANGAIRMFAAMQDVSEDDMAGRLSHTLALRRMPSADEMAAVIAFLASSDSACMTGSCVTADCGAMIYHGGSFDG